MKGVWKGLRFGNHEYETLSPPKQTKHKFESFPGREKGLGWQEGVQIACVQLKLDSDSSMVSCGLKNT